MDLKISAKQAGYTAAAFILTSALLTKGVYMYLRQDSWVAVILSFLVSLLFVFVYAVLNKWFPSKSLTEINEIVFGKIAGAIISAMYLFYFFTLIILNARDISGFVGYILPTTPTVIIMAIFLYICSWAVRKGPWNIASYGPLVLFVSLFVIILDTVLLVKEFDLRRLMPAFTFPPVKYIAGTHLLTALPLCEIFVFFMFVPYLQEGDALGKVLFKGLAVGAATLLFIVSRDILVLGDMLLVFALPTYSVIRLIDVGDVLTRVEILYAVILIALMFIKISVLYYATVSAAARLAKTSSHIYLIRITGALSVIFGLSVFGAEYEHMDWTNRAAPIYSSFFIMLLPLLTLGTAAIRGLNKQKG